MGEFDLNNGYPALADISTLMNARGLEIVKELDPNFYDNFRRMFWGIIRAVDWALVLGVYCPSPTTFNVIGGHYNWNGAVKTFTAGAAIDPADNDTTYVWMTDANTIGSDIDGAGWPAGDHIKLAEIDVDAAGVITAVRDLRGQTFLRFNS